MEEPQGVSFLPEARHGNILVFNHFIELVKESFLLGSILSAVENMSFDWMVRIIGFFISFSS